MGDCSCYHDSQDTKAAMYLVGEDHSVEIFIEQYLYAVLRYGFGYVTPPTQFCMWNISLNS